MEREGQGTGRVTHEEALQRVNRNLEFGKDGHSLLLLSPETVEAVMSAEYRKVCSSAKAAKETKEAMAPTKRPRTAMRPLSSWNSC